MFRVVVAAAAASPLVLPADSLLDLGDGNFLRGEPVMIKDDTVIWKHALSGAEFTCPVATARQMVFANGDQASPNGDIILLDNGDLLAGQLASLDKDWAVFQSPATGSIKLPRHRLRTARLASGGGDATTYEDAGDLAGWMTNTPDGKPLRWKAVNKSLHFNGRGQETIGKDVKMPVSADVSFEMAWSVAKTTRLGIGPELTMVLCADKAKPEQNPTGYVLNFNRNWLTVTHVTNDPAARQNATLGRVQLSPFLEGKSSMRVRVIVNRTTRRIHILINGTEAGDLQDEAAASPEGTAIQLTAEGDTGLRLRNLRVEAWNGLIGNKLSASTKSAQDKDLLLAADGDEIFGEIKSVRDDPKFDRVVEMIIPVSQSNAMAIPVAKIRHLSFARKTQDEAKAGEAAAAEGKTVVRLANGSRLTGMISAFDGKTLDFLFLGKEPIALPVASILSIDFPTATAEAAKPAVRKNNRSDAFDE